MSVKIFLPHELFYTKENSDIYGEIHINDRNSVSYFVIAASTQTKPNVDCGELRHLGHISRAGSYVGQNLRDVSISFCYDHETPNIYLHNLSIKPANATHANVFLYDVHKLLELHCDPVANNRCSSDSDNYNAEQYDDIRMLFQLLRLRSNVIRSPNNRHTSIGLFVSAMNFPLEAIDQIFFILMECKPVAFFVKKTVFYEHYLDWKKFRATGKRSYNIALDKLLGICVMFILLFYISHPGDHLIQSSHFVIKKLRTLLQALKGSPIGLKLNVQLNNFFLDCFNYHIDLWATFLNLIEPVIRELFVPIALLGSMGLSFQLAMLSDLISIIGLHAHCFYIYTAALYKVEIKGLQVLWKVVLGKRLNLLKNRVESHNYMNRQLYLATLFFTSLLFLFPTILVYYIVFTTLRLGIYFIDLMLRAKRRQILEFPLEVLLKWLKGTFYEIDSLQLQHKDHEPSPLLQPKTTKIRMSLFTLNVQSSSLGRVFSCESGVLKELISNEQSSISSIFHRVLQGKF